MKCLTNARLLKSNGSWIYCSSCHKTVGYLCYSTYRYFEFYFTCHCGNQGIVKIGDILDTAKPSKENLVMMKKRLICPIDHAPLFSVVDKHIEDYCFQITCSKCHHLYTLDNVEHSDTEKI